MSLVSWTLLGAMGLGAAAPPTGNLAFWTNELARARGLLAEPGKPRAWRAAEVCQHLITKRVKELVGEPSAPDTLAQALTLWAVASLRQGQTEEARWRLAEAASFSYGQTRQTLQGFADALESLGAWLAGLEREQVVDRYTSLPGSYAAPRPVQLQPLPATPSSLDPEELSPARVLLLVSELGPPEAPVLLQPSGDVSFDLALMESLRSWVFSPASQDGRPTKGFYLITATVRSASP